MSASPLTPVPAHPRRPLVLAAIASAGAAVLAGCAAKTAPPPAAPPPAPKQQVVEAVPYRPLPPGGAHYVMEMPARGPDGQRVTVNSNLSDDQLVWNLRSAWNVAALNCLSAEYEPILAGYRTFLTRNARTLKAVNDRLESSYARRHRTRRDAIVARDGYTTQVYNFFAEPAARAGFCRATLDMANRAAAATPADPLTFARENFPVIMQPFEQFFDEYEAYQRASAEWDAKWGAQYGASQPGWVAVQQARASGVTIPAAAPAQSVIDPATGVAVPVIPVREGVTAQPVVQPIAPKPAPQTKGKPKRK